LAPLAWVGSVLFLVSLGHLLSWAADLPTERLAVTALLLHATALLLAALGLRVVRRSSSEARASFRPFASPLRHSVLVSTGLALPVVLLVDEGDVAWRAVATGWLSALWLVYAWTWVRRGLFAACQ